MRTSILVIALLATGCRGSNAASHANVEVNPNDPRVQLVAGKAWAIGSRTSSTSHAHAGALTAYLDLDGNDRLDLFHEPASWCTKDKADWQCNLKKETLTVHRMDKWSEDLAQHLSTTFVYHERYDDNWQALAASKLCSSTGKCSEVADRAFADVAKPTRRLNACDHQWPAPLVLQVGDREETVRDPGRAEVTARSQGLSDGSVEVTVEASIDSARIIVWLAEMNDDGTQRQLIWTSEDPTAEPKRLSGQRLVASIPFPAIERCSADCRIGAQAAKQTRQGDILFVVEGRTTTKLPSRKRN